MVLTLYKLDASPPVRAVLMTIEALDIQGVEYVDVNLLDGDHLKREFLNINPQHTVPTLTDDDFVIWDSHAIAGYLVTKFSDNDSLYPSEPKKRAIIDQRLHFNSSILFPALRGTVEPVIFRGEKTYRAENLDKVISAYNFTNQFFDSSWLTGEEITLADICCIASISSMNEIVPVDEEIFPKLSAWMRACAEQDFYEKGNRPGLELFSELLKSKLELA